MAHAAFRRFVRDRQALDEVLSGAKQMACPHCHRSGMVVGHGLLVGYAERGSDREIRGRRLLCSGRFRRAGCGRTFSVLLATVIAGFVVRTGTLSRMAGAVLGGLCRKTAWERICTPGLSLRSGYRLWARLLAAQSHLRTRLCAVAPPPASADDRPLAQLFAHLGHVTRDSTCVLAGFQLALQSDLFG
jgi:hypothetical protein